MRRFLSSVYLATALALAIALAPAAARADLASGLKAFDAGDFATAQRELLPLQDNPEAAFALGVMADHGLGMRPDAATALRYYTTAARGGVVAAITNLGLFYDIGRAVPRDGTSAQRLYSVAAHADNVMAKNNLAYLWGRQNGLLDEALCLSAETLRAEPHNSAYLDTYGFILLRLNRLDDAEKFFQKALQEKNDGVAAEHMGDVARLRGDSAGAQRWWRRALDLADRDYDAQHMRAKLAGKPDDLDQHPPFKLQNDGFGKECAMPAV